MMNTSKNGKQDSAATSTADDAAAAAAVAMVNLQEPDVVVVVGGKEFHENSHFLRAISNYFEAAFRSGMKESQTMRFEFPEKKPEQRELIMSLARPFPNKQTTNGNFSTALSGFEELDIPFGREHCGNFVLEQLKRSAYTKILREPIPDPATNTVYRLFTYLQASYQSNLIKSKARCVELVKKLLEDSPFSLHRDDWAILCTLLAEHKDCHEELFSSFERILPAGLVEKQHDDQVELLNNVLLPDLICAEVQRKEKDAGVKEIVRVAKFYSHCNQSIPSNLQVNDICAKVMERPTNNNSITGYALKDKKKAWTKLWRNQTTTS